MIRGTIIIESDIDWDDNRNILHKCEWHFWQHGTELIFDRYIEYKRDTARHKFREYKIWSRLSHEPRTVDLEWVLSTTNVELVAKQAKEKMFEMIKVKWGDE